MPGNAMMKYILALFILLVSLPALAQIPQVGMDFTRNACTDRGAPISCTQLFTTTRALGTWCTDASGNMTQVGVNTPCITSAGLEVWEPRTNYNLQSNTFTDAAWAKGSTTVTAAAAVAPDGTMTASKIVENTVLGGHYIRQIPQTGINGGTGVYIVYLKAAGRTAVGLQGNARGIGIDLTNCTTQSMSANGLGAPNVGSGAVSLPNGWCKLWFADTTANQAGTYISMMTGFTGSNTTYTGDGVSGVYVWQADAQVGAFPTPPVTTTTATVTRPGDNHATIGRLSTTIAQATGTVQATTSGSQQGVAATIVENSAVLLGKTAGNLVVNQNGFVTVGSANAATWTAINDAGTSWDASGRVVQTNGGTVGTDTRASTLTGASHIGATGGSSVFWNGYINRLFVFSSKLPAPGTILNLASLKVDAVPSIPPATQQITLSWPSTYGESVSVDRWLDNGTPTSIGMSSTGSFVDTTVPAVNTVYSYRISRTVRGTSVSPTSPMAVSDMTKPFVCPFIPDVASNLLGVDRTESFNSPNGSTVSFTIRAPIAANQTTVNVPQCTTCTPGVSDDRANIMAQVASGKKIQLSAGDYIIDPGSDSLRVGINGLSLTDFSLVGAGRSNGIPLTRLHFKNGTGALPKGIQLSGNRILMKDFSIDWDVLCPAAGPCNGGNAIPGIISTINPTTQRFTVQNPSYYVPNPANPPDLRAVNNYLLSNRAWDLRYGGRVGLDATFNSNFAVDGLYYYTLAGSQGYYADGGGALGYVRTSVGFQLGAGGSDYSVEGVSIYGGGGPGFILGSDGIGFRFSNFQITRKPDSLLIAGEQPRYAAIFGDSDANSTQGSILIENSEFGWVGDDWFYNRGAAIALTTLTSTSSFTLTFGANPGSGLNGHGLANDVIQFIDPNTVSVIGGVSAPTTWDPQVNNGDGTWSKTAHFAPIPALAPYIGLPANQLPIVYELPYSGPNMIVRNSCFHDGPSRLLIKSQNFLVDSNTFGNGYYSMIELSSDPEMLKEGPNPTNGIIRNNKSFGSGGADLNQINGGSGGYWLSQGVFSGPFSTYGIGGYNQNKGFIPGAVNNVVSAPYQNIWITDNLLSNIQGLGLGMHGGGNVVLARNTIVNANLQPFTPNFNTTYCGALSQGYQSAGSNQPWCLPKVAAQGSLMVSWSKDVLLSNNRFLGTSIGTTFVAPNNTPWSRNMLMMLH
jgi:hypothetical protein